VVIIVIKHMPDAVLEMPQQLVENQLCFLLHEVAPIGKIQENVPDG